MFKKKYLYKIVVNYKALEKKLLSIQFSMFGTTTSSKITFR